MSELITNGVSNASGTEHAISTSAQQSPAASPDRPQVRRRDVKVVRVMELPAQRDGIASPEHCWPTAASTGNPWISSVLRRAIAHHTAPK